MEESMQRIFFPWIFGVCFESLSINQDLDRRIYILAGIFSAAEKTAAEINSANILSGLFSQRFEHSGDAPLLLFHIGMDVKVERG